MRDVRLCTRLYSVHPIGDEGCPEGEPAVYALVQCTLLLVMRDVWKVSLLYTLIQCTLLVGDEGCLEGEPAVHTYTVYTPIGDEGYPEGEPVVYTLIQCTLLLVMRDVQKVSLLCTHLYSVHSYW